LAPHPSLSPTGLPGQGRGRGEGKDAENAIKKVQKSGLDMRMLSIVSKDYQTKGQVVGVITVGDRVKFWRE